MTNAGAKMFRIIEYVNRGGSISWRVEGRKDGLRLRENYASHSKAESRRLELEFERLGQPVPPEMLRPTTLSFEEIRLAESAFAILDDPRDLLRAIEQWTREGVRLSANTVLRLDEVVALFIAWLPSSGLRPVTQRNLRLRVQMFASEMGDRPLGLITPDCIQQWMESRKVARATHDGDRRAVSRFFSWCIARPQRYLTANPCREIRLSKATHHSPEIFTLHEALRLLIAAKRVNKGYFLKFIVLQLFGGLRPFEALRLRADQINLKDAELRLEAHQSKTGRPRVVSVVPVLGEWLRICPAGPAKDPNKYRRLWARLRQRAKLDHWVADGLRHTAISHHFRRTGSYGLTAEWAGNSEGIIKNHYQGRVSSEETARFWNLFPDRKRRIEAASRKAIRQPEAKG